MFKEIKGIKYDGGDAGRAFDGGVYGASCTIGFSNASTKITLNVVSEDGEYDISDNDLDVTSAGAHTISVGDVDFKRMYLYAYSFNNSPTAKTLTVNFVDQSLCLDKIFVGLTGRHGTMSVHDPNFYGWNAYNPSNTIQVTAFAETFAFRIFCLECNSLTPSKVVEPAWNEPPYDITRLLYMAGDGNACPFPLGTYIQVRQGQPNIDGGYMLLGKETFSDTNCEIPKVDYSFNDLCDALDYILGGNPHGCPPSGDAEYRHNLRNFNRSASYRANYTGTLREVLSAWAADFSFDFTFDYEKEKLWVEGIDLQDSIDLTPIRNALDDGFGPDSDDGLIRSHTERHSLENTYRQSPLVKYIKPPRQFQRSKKHYEPALGKVLKPSDALRDTIHLGRSDDELYVSMALAKYSPEARIIWLSDVAREKWEQDTKTAGGDPGPIKSSYGHHTVGVDGWLATDAWQNPIPYPAPAPQDKFGKLIPNNHAPQKWCSNWTACVCGGNPCPSPEKAIEANCNLCENLSSEVGWKNPHRRLDVPWVALGFFPTLEIGDDVTPSDLAQGMPAKAGLNRKQQMLQMFGKGKVGNQTKAMNHPIWNNPLNYSVYIGIWNKAYQRKVEEFDRELANSFLGQYGYWHGDRELDPELDNLGPVNPPIDEKQCPRFWFDLEGNQDHALYMYQHKISTIPESKIYSGHSYPFQNILRANGGFFSAPIDPNTDLPIPDTEPHCTYCPERAIFKIEDNSWGTPPETVDDMLKNHFIVDTELTNNFANNLVPQSDIYNYVPVYAFLNEKRHIESFLINIAKLPNYRDSIAKPEYMESGYFPGIAIIPRMQRSKIPQNDANGKLILDIDTGHWNQNPPVEYLNAMVYQNARRRLLESVQPKPNDCILYCEEDIVNTICKCPDIDEPIHGFTNYSGRFFNMKHLAESRKIVFPIEHDYTGFWVSDISHKGTYPRKQIVMGQPPLPTELEEGYGVMSTRIVDVDVTQDLDALETQANGKFEEQLVITNPYNDANEVITLPEYYTFLQSVTHPADSPNESITVRVDGTEFDTLKKAGEPNLLSPAFGLSSFTITLGTDGIATDLSYQSRPQKLPKRDVLLQNIGPRAIEGRIPRQPIDIKEGEWNVREQKHHGDTI